MIGDYVAGSNHVQADRTQRFSSGLSVPDSQAHPNPETRRRAGWLAPAAMSRAGGGPDAHRRSIAIARTARWRKTWGHVRSPRRPQLEVPAHRHQADEASIKRGNPNIEHEREVWRSSTSSRATASS